MERSAADLLRGGKDRKQVIGLSDFEADYVILRLTETALTRESNDQTSNH